MPQGEIWQRGADLLSNPPCQIINLHRCNVSPLRAEKKRKIGR